MISELVDAVVKINLAAAAAIVIILLVRRPLRRIGGPVVSYALWLIMPLTATASLLPLRTVVAPLPETPVFEVMPATIRLLAQAQAAQDAEPVVALAGAWMLGALLCMAACVFVQMHSFRGLGPLRPLTGERRTFTAQAVGFGPAVIGAFAPRIILPADFETRFAPAERTVVLAHENVHLGRGDALVNALAVFCQCLFWFNPFVHIGAHVMRLDQELACDAEVMRQHPKARRVYAQAMLKTQMAPSSLPLGCYWPARGEHPLRERITALKSRAPGMLQRRIGIAAACILMTGFGVAAWAVQPPVLRGPELLPGDARLANSGFVNFFDATSPVEIKGIVSRVDWKEPRTFIHVTDESGKAWAGMGDSPGKIDVVLRERLSAGTPVIMKGYRAWDRSCNGGCAMIVRHLTAANGQPIILTSDRK